MYNFTSDYFLMVFVASIGVLQIIASMRQINGLLFVKSPVLIRIIGTALILGVAFWFFTNENRNINDYDGGIDAPTQSLLFFLASVSALLFTLALSTLVNFNMDKKTTETAEGIDILKNTNYGRALSRNMRYWWREWRTKTKTCFFG